MSSNRSRNPLALGGCLLLAVTASLAHAGVYTAPGGPLVDKPATAFGEASFPLVISGTGETVTSVNSVTWTDFSHTWVGDVNIVLIAPNGTIATLYGPPDNDSSNLNGTYVMTVDPLVQTLDEASVPLGDDQTIPSGTYAISDYLNANDPGPRSSFDALLGSPVDGTWTLRVRDYGPGDTGALGSWSLSVNAVSQPGVAGDVNGDGVVNLGDINYVTARWLNAGPAGDANGDGTVNLGDINYITARWLNTSAPTGVPVAALAAVPEPASLSFLAIASFAAASRRRRRVASPDRRTRRI